MIKKNDEIKLKIDALTSLGSGIGRFKEMAVFVDGTAVGDEIIAHIIKSLHYAYLICEKYGNCDAIPNLNVPDWNRTSGVPLRRRTLYPTEVLEHANLILTHLIYDRQGNNQLYINYMGISL